MASTSAKLRGLERGKEGEVVSAANEWRVWWVIELRGVGSCRAMEERIGRGKGGHCPKIVRGAW